MYFHLEKSGNTVPRHVPIRFLCLLLVHAATITDNWLCPSLNHRSLHRKTLKAFRVVLSYRSTGSPLQTAVLENHECGLVLKLGPRYEVIMPPEVGGQQSHPISRPTPVLKHSSDPQTSLRFISLMSSRNVCDVIHVYHYSEVIRNYEHIKCSHRD